MQSKALDIPLPLRHDGDRKEEPGKRRREPYLDIAKFLAIYLVVVHHFRDYAGDPTVYPNMPLLENMGLVTTVAIFFAVSGYLARPMTLHTDFSKLGHRLVAYLWPVLTVVIWGGILLQYVLTGTYRAPAMGWMRQAFSVGWFFWCLALCETLTFAAHWLSRRRSWVLVTVLGVCFLVLWALPVGMFHAIEMLPSYWFGMFILPWLLERPWARFAGILSLVIHLMWASFAGDFTACGLSYHVHTVHLFELTPHSILLQLERWILALTGACGFIVVLRELVTRCPIVARLAPLGTQTLGVFFFHVHVLVVYYATIGWTGGGIFGRLTIAATVFAVAFVLSWLTNRWKPLAATLWNPLLLFKGKNRIVR